MFIYHSFHTGWPTWLVLRDFSWEKLEKQVPVLEEAANADTFFLLFVHTSWPTWLVLRDFSW
jgi:hypothetical protein